ncbi:hypothetical protein MAHJHV55_51680 [Mycobacterium avium subsp. hominissuis]
MALVVLGLLFSPAAVRWAAGRDPEARLMRPHRQIPGDRQQQQLGDHRQPAASGGAAGWR